MSTASKPAHSPLPTGPTSKAGRKPKRTYEHEATDQEKFAVAMFLQARKACNIAIDLLRSGDGTPADALQASVALINSMAGYAFGDKQGGNSAK